MEAAEVLASAVRLAAEGSADSDEYWDLIQTLHHIPEQHVFDLAAACCLGPTAAERTVGATVLAQLGFPNEWDETGKRPFTDQSDPILRALLSDADERVVESAIHALGHHSIGTAADLRDLAHHPSWRVRDAVAFALDPDDSAAREILFELMNDQHDGVRDWATFSIGAQTDVDTPQIREALARRLTDSDKETRGEAMVGLARRGDRRVIEMIVANLDPEASYLVKDAAEEILVHYPDEHRVIEALSRCASKD